MQRFHWTTGAFTSFLLAAVFGSAAGCGDAGGQGAGREEAPLAASGIAWQSCGEGIRGECATISVPIDWRKPNGAKFDLAIGRLPALEPENRIGVLLLNPGGPGASGIDSYIVRGSIPADTLIRKRFDIVTWDPRGVARSHGVLCRLDLVEQPPRAFPKTEREFRGLLEYSAELGRDCRTHSGPIFDHVDTVSTVRDLDAIRAALGEEKLSYMGVSYGTEIGQQYAELFPERIRAMVLDSNVDHSVDSVYDYLAMKAEDFESSFVAFADWCDRTTGCTLHGRDVRALWDALYKKAEEGALVDPSTGEPIPLEDLRELLFFGMYNPRSWGRLSQLLASLADETATPENATRAALKAAAQGELGSDAYGRAIGCQDWKWNLSFRELVRYRERLATVAPHVRMGALWQADITDCLRWPSRVANPQHELCIANAPTILVVTAAADVATPHRGNIHVHEQIDNSVLLQYDGIGHGQRRQSPCIDGHVQRYLTTLELPPPNTHCPALWPE